MGEEDAERGSRANERAHLGPHISGACGTKVVSCDEEEVEGGVKVKRKQRARARVWHQSQPYPLHRHHREHDIGKVPRRGHRQQLPHALPYVREVVCALRCRGGEEQCADTGKRHHKTHVPTSDSERGEEVCT